MRGVSLDDFSSHPQVHPSSLRLAYSWKPFNSEVKPLKRQTLLWLIEAVDDLQSEFTASEDLRDTNLCKLRRMESQFEQWLVHWDAAHESPWITPPCIFSRVRP